ILRGIDVHPFVCRVRGPGTCVGFESHRRPRGRTARIFVVCYRDSGTGDSGGSLLFGGSPDAETAVSRRGCASASNNHARRSRKYSSNARLSVIARAQTTGAASISAALYTHSSSGG